MAKKQQSIIDILKEETPDVNYNPVLNEPSIVIFKDGKFYEEVAKSRIKQWLKLNTRIQYHDMEKAIDRPCHITGWSFKNNNVKE
ncbi:TPA: hypothetical protein U2I12_000721 [Citrobacter farmeri]|uniref:hypothetical protein n=1 Tax=Citrobacter farmeri TaxID=67824 RepID=UPI000F68B0C7|nr:hypothetical protein [Citrobacter farmeri]RSB18612.1 hypothetical protein EGK65_02605 [Citrobacter farmeri]HEM6628078.1 hypothetical protein [Citrobacter farmeri]